MAAVCLSAQSTPPLYYGPYEQPSASQFAGEWTRSDGTYKMVVSVSEDGAIATQYFNPAPINVESTTVATDEEGVVTLEIVLRDEGYPGSSYELQYLPQYHVIVGSYSIPGQEPAEVYFTR
ncbi:hypothetical protein ACWPKO_16250 [Coraliomargarita sp. W4R53]